MGHDRNTDTCSFQNVRLRYTNLYMFKNYLNMLGCCMYIGL